MGIKHRLAALALPGWLEARALRRRGPGEVTVLMYHEVLPDSVDLPSWLVVTATDFERQMRHLAQHYDVLSLDEALDRHTAAPARRGRPAAVVTFDDGYAGNLHHVLPVMKRLGLPFTVYVATARIESGGRYWYDEVICALLAAHGPLVIKTSRGPIEYRDEAGPAVRRWARIDAVLSRMKALPADERCAIAERLARPDAVPALRMLTPAELGTLAGEPGVTIGNHTHTHDLLDQLSEDEARAVILAAQERLERWTARPVRHFSYPNGNCTPALAALVASLGFQSAVTTRPGAWRAGQPAHEIPRIGVGRFDALNLVRAKAAGLV